MSGGDASGEMAAMVAYMATFDDPAEAKARLGATPAHTFCWALWSVNEEPQPTHKVPHTSPSLVRTTN
jgi:hypothetical protein